MQNKRDMKKKTVYNTTSQKKPNIVTDEQKILPTQEETEIDVKWSELKITGKNIQRRRNHSSVLHDGKIYIYGGYEVNQGLLNDFYSMQIKDAATYQWESVHNEDELAHIPYYPGKRKKHSTLVYKDKMFMFGGLISSLENTNCVNCFDFLKREWIPIELKNKDIQPPPQDSQAIVIDESRKRAILFGGFQKQLNKVYSNSLWAFDLENYAWSTINPKTDVLPAPRRNSSIAIENGVLYMFGGTNCDIKFDDFWSFDLTSQLWTRIKTNGAQPESRHGHSIFSYNKKIILFGGIHSVTHEKNDMCVYDIDRNEWKVVDNDTSHNTDDLHDIPYSPPDAISQIDQDYIKRSQIGKTLNVVPDVYNKKTNMIQREYKQMKRINNIDQTTVKEDTKSSITQPALTQYEENKKRSDLSKKIDLLSEFEIVEVDKEVYNRSNSPTTEAVKDKISSVGNPMKNKKYLLKNMEISNIIGQQQLDFKSNKIVGRRPCAREGQSVTVVDHCAIIFGGDRHLMAYNDIYMVDLDMVVSSYH